MLELKDGQFGLVLLAFVGYCGEVPVSLVKKMGGYYDYRRRVVTELVRDGYLKERKFQGYDRHKVRSLSLTEKGLSKLWKERPDRARRIEKHMISPANGQGDWKKTLRLHRNAASILVARRLGAKWEPGREKNAARGSELVYYSAYEINKESGRDNKGARLSGILIEPYGRYFPIYYLGEHNMFWNESAEEAFREQFQNSALGRNCFYGKTLLVGENWELAENLALHGHNAHSRMIHFDGNDRMYYAAFDDYGFQLMRMVMDEHELYCFQKYLQDHNVDEIVPYPTYLFDIDSIASYHQSPKRRKTMFTPTRGAFFDFQIPVMEAINNVGAHLDSIPAYWLDRFREEGES